MGLIIDPEMRGEMFQCDTRGTITTGRRNPQTNQPESLDYFNVEKFEEILHYYGKKPATFIIAFPSEYPKEFITFRCVQWGKNRETKRVCNRKTFFVRFDQFKCKDEENNTNIFYRVGENYPCEFPACACTVDFSFLAFVLNPQTGKSINWLPIKFKNTSFSAGQRFLTELELRKGLVKYHPFKLWVEMKKSGMNKFPVWGLEAFDFRSNPALAEKVSKTNYEMLEFGRQNLLEAADEEMVEEKTVMEMIELIDDIPAEKDSMAELEALGQEIAGKVEGMSEKNKEKIREKFKQKKNDITTAIQAWVLFSGNKKGKNGGDKKD